MCFELADLPVPDQFGRCPPGYFATADFFGPYCEPLPLPGSSSIWGGIGVGFGVSDDRVTALEMRTLNILDALSPDTSAGLGSTYFRGDVALGWDTILGNWPNLPNMAPFPVSVGIQGTLGYSDRDERVDRIPGAAFFTPNGPGSDFVRLEGGFEATVGGRLGTVLPGTGTFIYVAGGAAFQQFEATVNCGTGLCQPNGIPQQMLTASQWLTGYYYGGGITWPLSRHARFGIEIRQTDYGSWNVVLGDPAQYQGNLIFDNLNEFSAMARLNIKIPTSGGMVASDARLKRDVEFVGRLDDGLGLYRYRYHWSEETYVGVMAQEVALTRRDAVKRGDDGYLRVDYGRLGLRLQTWEEWKAAHPGS